MRKIINGLAYDSDTAREVCDITPLRARQLGSKEFEWEDTRLYRTGKGQFFIAGEGGAMTRWKREIELNKWTGGSGLVLVGEEEARSLVAHHGDDALYEELFGKPEEG